MILTFFLISRTFLIDWYMICMGFELKKNFSGRGCVSSKKLVFKTRYLGMAVWVLDVWLSE